MPIAQVKTNTLAAHSFIKQPAMRFAFVFSAALLVMPMLARSAVQAAPPISGLLGTIVAISSNAVDVATQSGTVHVGIQRPLVTYQQRPSDLSHVTANAYVGIPTIEEANGVAIAKQIMIFPAALRGAAEGSVSTDATPEVATHSRMTNGSVSKTAVHSRMTNGTVQKGGTTLVVNYQGGAKRITVPADVAVTEIAPSAAILGARDVVYVATTQAPGGAFETNKIFLFVQAPRKVAR